MMALGSFAATSSISIPPAAEAMKTLRADLTVEHDAQIQLARDGQRLFNEQPLHYLAFGTGLVGNQIHAQHLRSQRRSFFGVHGDLHAAAFAAATSMNLRFNDYTRGALAQQ